MGSRTAFLARRLSSPCGWPYGSFGPKAQFTLWVAVRLFWPEGSVLIPIPCSWIDCISSKSRPRPRPGCGVGLHIIQKHWFHNIGYKRFELTIWNKGPTNAGPSRQLKIKRMIFGGSGDILCERMVGCLENGPKWCSILVLQLRCEQGSCSIFMDPG